MTGGYGMRASSVLFLLMSFVFHQVLGEELRVAIIGSGIGGSSAAYFIEEQLSGANVTVKFTVFEKENRIGGRMKHINHEGGTFEMGASIVYDGNLYAKEIVDALGLKRVKPPHMDGRMGIWNGNELVFEQAEWKFVSILKMVWRYGFGVLQIMDGIVHEMLERFNHIYALQGFTVAHIGKGYLSCGGDSGSCGFETWEEMWRELNLYDLMQKPFSAFLEQRMGADVLLVDELIQSVNRVNYNQGNGLNALAGSISLCPLVTGELFCVEGGNVRLAEAALSKVKADVRTGVRVAAVEVDPRDGWSYSLWVQPLQGGGGQPPVRLDEPPFHAVVFAAPLEPELSGGGLQLLLADTTSADTTTVTADAGTGAATASSAAGDGDDSGGGSGLCGGGGFSSLRALPLLLPPRDFQTTHSTFVRGALRPEAFGHTALTDLPDTILTTGTASPFSSISIQWRDDGGSGGDGGEEEGVAEADRSPTRLYKVFSREPLTGATLEQYFERQRVVGTMPWLAYPRFAPPERFAPIRLMDAAVTHHNSSDGGGDGDSVVAAMAAAPRPLYYINGIETAASALEISMIGARNIALLLKHDWLISRNNITTSAGTQSAKESHISDAGSQSELRSEL